MPFSFFVVINLGEESKVKFKVIEQNGKVLPEGKTDVLKGHRITLECIYPKSGVTGSYSMIRTRTQTFPREPYKYSQVSTVYYTNNKVQ